MRVRRSRRISHRQRRSHRRCRRRTHRRRCCSASRWRRRSAAPARGDSPLGNLFTDAYRAAIPGADVSINNTSGGLRADLPAGPLTYGSVFEVMPFDNRLVVFHLTGAELRTVLATQMTRVPALVGCQACGCVSRANAAWCRRQCCGPNGTPVSDSERLLIATTDFLATGGDNIFVPSRRRRLRLEQDIGLVRDVVVDSLRKRGGTLREDQLVDPGEPAMGATGQGSCHM